MSSDPAFAEFVLEQASLAGDVRVRRMFGEYALYVDERVVAFLIDDQFFLKPTPGVQGLLINVEEAIPIPSFKPHYLLTEELEDRAVLARILQYTAERMEPPKPKR